MPFIKKTRIAGFLGKLKFTELFSEKTSKKVICNNMLQVGDYTNYYTWVYFLYKLLI